MAKTLAIREMTLSPFARLSVPILLMAWIVAAAAPAEAQGVRKIWPKSSRTVLENPNLPALAIPLRFYFEYGNTSSESDPNPLGVVDTEVDRYTIGADFVTTSMWFWGVSLSALDTSDNGSGPFAPSLVTDKDIDGASAYLAHSVAPALFAGVNVYYNTADGLSIFNMADRVTEDSKLYGFRPFFTYVVLERNDLEVTVGGDVNFNYAKFDYVNNIPPTASLRNVIAHVPVTVTRDFGRRVQMSGFARLNRILSLEVFDNVPPPDRTTVTLGFGASYIFDNGVKIYAGASHDFWDDAYDTSRASVGVSVPFSIFPEPGRGGRALK